MVCPSRISAYSLGTGSLTFTIISARAQMSAAFSTIFPPATSYRASAIPLPTPAPFSISTWCPRAVSAATPPGTSPTRYSRVLISFGQPMIISSLRSRFALRKRAAEDSRQSPRVKLRRVEMLKLLFADPSGRVYEHPELLALVRDGLSPEPAERLPAHATLAALPGRRPGGLGPPSGRGVG